MMILQFEDEILNTTGGLGKLYKILTLIELEMLTEESHSKERPDDHTLLTF